MIKHFNSMEDAVSDLRAHGWSEIQPGSWVNKNGDLRATIHSAPGVAVRVLYSAIQ